MPQSEKIPILIPGLNNIGPDHWQTKWQNRLPNAVRVELGGWNNPRRSAWVTNLGIAIRQVAGPKILVAHSLGCHAVDWWGYNRTSANGLTAYHFLTPSSLRAIRLPIRHWLRVSKPFGQHAVRSANVSDQGALR